MHDLFHLIYNLQNTKNEKKKIIKKLEKNGIKKKLLTDLAVINMFHGIRVPIPWINNVKNINLYLSYGGLISILALSIVIPLKFSSSFGRFFSSQAGVSLTGSLRNGALSVSFPSKIKLLNWLVLQIFLFYFIFFIK